MNPSRWGLCFLILAAIALIFKNLDDRYLWDDEAETALLAKNILKYGLPVALDGENLISQRSGFDYGENYVWRMHPWLPMFITAGSFGMFGVNTFTARLPFAILGVLCIPSIYFISRSLFQRRSIALLSAAFLLVNVSFLLYSRQCRYYALSIFLGIWVIYFFWQSREAKRFSLLGLFCVLFLMFHSNFLVFFSVVAGLGLASLVFGISRWQFKLALVGAGVLALNLPFYSVYDVWGSTQAEVHQTFGRFLIQLRAATLKLDLFALPMAVVIFLGVYLLKKGATDERRWFMWLGIYFVGNVLVIAWAPFLFFRYLIHLLPICAIALAWSVFYLWKINRGLCLILSGCLMASNLFYGWSMLILRKPPKYERSFTPPIVRYFSEISTSFKGPVKGLVEFLKREAKPGEVVFITQGDLPLRFHTDLQIRGGLGRFDPAKEPEPDWIIVRHFFRMSPPFAEGKKDEALMREFLNKKMPSYQKKELAGVVDCVYENIPEPEAHLFETPVNGPELIIYRRIKE
jgi:hypothetical protein